MMVSHFIVEEIEATNVQYFDQRYIVLGRAETRLYASESGILIYTSTCAEYPSSGPFCYRHYR